MTSDHDLPPAPITRISLRGYKSIRECDLVMGSRNVLIGANGAGKSNFIGFFRLVSRLVARDLRMAVAQSGGPDLLLHFGRKTTPELYCKLNFGDEFNYGFSLVPTVDNRLAFSEELIGEVEGVAVTSRGYFESEAHLYDSHGGGNPLDDAFKAMRSWMVYHFHDTSDSALVKQIHGVRDNEYLRPDARNLAAFLLRLKTENHEHYRRILKTVRLVAPYFGDFVLRPVVGNGETIQLEWTEVGQDVPFPPSALSDGTLRFICLATVLLQPDAFMPSTVFIDEPELGLHPFAVKVLGGLMKSLSRSRQLIISTQSVVLVDEFEAEDLIVVEKLQGASRFSKPDAALLKEWLDQYSLGELWQKNLLRERPSL